MDKKNYLWIGIGVIAVVIALLLVMKTTNTSGVKNTPTTTGTETGSSTKTEDVNQPVDTIAPIIADTMPLSNENIIEVTGKTFTLKTIKVKSGEKVFITLSAKDDTEHAIGFIDDALSFITMKFSKAGGNQSITFPAPQIGTYTYYIDNKTNTGKLIVE